MNRGSNVPPVDLVKDRVSLGLAVLALEVFAYPLNKVIFKHSLDELVEEIWSYQFVNICAGKMFGEGLMKIYQGRRVMTREEEGLTVMLSITPYVSQRVFESNADLHTPVCSGDRKRGSGWSRSSGREVQLDR
jgi:hypothetical protein